MAESNPQFTLELQNNGIGPAIITDFQVLLDGKREEHFEAQGWMAILDCAGLKGKALCGVIEADEFLAAGQSLQIVKYESQPSPIGIRDLRKALRRIEIHIEYQSVYKDSYSTHFDIRVSIQDGYEEPA